jgi:hypothetical protein
LCGEVGEGVHFHYRQGAFVHPDDLDYHIVFFFTPICYTIGVVFYIMKKISFLVSCFFLFFLVTPVFATFSFVSQGVWFSDNDAFAGDIVKIYTVVVNNDFAFFSADVEFLNNGSLIGTTRVVDLPLEGAKQVWIEYTLPSGEGSFTARLTNFIAKNGDGSVVSISSEEVAGFESERTYTIDLDTDGDDVGDIHDPDDDNDGLLDSREKDLGTNSLVSDTDGDGLSDKEEVDRGTDPVKEDTDGDGYKDNVDVFPTNGGEWADADGDDIGDNADPDDDNDGLSDIDEKGLGSDPLNSDTDGDGITDGKERDRGTDPTKVDSDGDGISDKDEFDQGLDPTTSDTDGDGLDDNVEIKDGTDPKKADTDEDGLSDKEEKDKGTDPLLVDTDGDGVNDLLDLFPMDATESADFDLDGEGNNVDTDDDGDGLSDIEEEEIGTDPLLADTDADGLNDKEEVDSGTDPNRADTDDDGRIDGEDENPLQADSNMLKRIVQFGAIGSFVLFVLFYSVYYYKRETA